MDNSSSLNGGHPSFRRVMVAAGVRAGLWPLAHYAQRFAASAATVRLVGLTSIPGSRCPLLCSDYVDWSHARFGLEALEGAEHAIAEVARHIGRSGNEPETELIDLSATYGSAAAALSRAAAAWGADLIALTACPDDGMECGAHRLRPEEIAPTTRCAILYMCRSNGSK